MSHPTVFAVPADIELAADPICPEWIIEGAPQAHSKRLAESSDGTAAVMAWSCTAGRFRWHYTVEETAYVISGEVFVTDEKGDVRRLGPGDMVFFPAGSCSLWYVPVEVRKIAFCRQAMPRPFGTLLRAWNKLMQSFAGEKIVHTGLEPSAARDTPGSDRRFIPAARGESAPA